MSVKLYFVADVMLADEEDPISQGDGKFEAEMPYDGVILDYGAGPVVSGFILGAGSGAGTYTEYQVRNVEQARDMFVATDKPRFNVDEADASGRASLSGGRLVGDKTFRRGDHLRLDCDAVPSGGDSAKAYLWLTCGFWQTVRR